MALNSSTLQRTGAAFAAGFLAVVLCHQGAWAILHYLHVVPRAAWSLAPVPPFGVPTVISQAFWGGVWAVVLDRALRQTEGMAYFAAWLVVGALALTLVAIFVVSPLKEHGAVQFSWARLGIGCIVNGAWGLGTGLMLRAISERHAERAW